MDVIEVLNDDVSEHSISLISLKVGVSEEQARAGIFAALPAVLAGLMKNSTANGTSRLTKMLPGDATDKPTSVPAPDLTESQSLFDRGVDILRDLFGEDTDSVALAVSEASGTSRQKSAGLLAMVTPVIINAISRLMSNEKWSLSDLILNLFNRKSHIVSSLPGTLSSTLGMASLHAPNLTGDTPALGGGTTRVEKGYTTSSSGSSYLKWFIIIILVALVAWWVAT